MLHEKIVISFIAATVASAMTFPSSAAVGDVHFKSDAYAIQGWFKCNGGAPSSLGDIDLASVDTTGDNIAIASNLALRACPGLLNPQGMPIYSIASAEDEAIATYTMLEDSGEAISDLDQVALLGGVVTYLKKTEDDKCTETATITCVGTTSIEGLMLGGSHITGTFDRKTVFPAVGISVPASACGLLGLAIFNGEMILNDAVNSEEEHVVRFAPITLNGKLSCVGTGLGRVDVHLTDATAIEYGLIAGGIAVAIISSVNSLGTAFPGTAVAH
jgi:hypothetical protein